MSTVYFSIFLYHFPFLSSMTYNFHYIEISPPWLNLFQSISLFLMLLQRGLYSLYLFQIFALFAYRKKAKFCILIFVSCNYMLISFNKFTCWRPQDFLSTRSYHVQTETILTSFLMQMFLFLFLCLIALARISSTMLNRNDRSEHPCPVSNLRGRTVNFHH